MRHIINALRYARNHSEKLFLFWSYALMAKLRITKYRSKKIALIRLDHIGDCIMFSDAAREISKVYKDHEITVICRPISRPIMESLGIFNKIICFDPIDADKAKYRTLFRELRSESYDILFQPVMSKIFAIDIISAATKCNQRISMEPNDSNIDPRLLKMTEFLYDRFVPYPRGHVSEFDIYAAFIRGTINSDYKSKLPLLRHKKQSFVDGDYYVLYPGGTLSQKFWPAEYFANIAEFVYQKTGWMGVICGVPSEQYVANKLKSHLVTAPVMDLIGKTSILDVVDIIAGAHFVVSNDTSGVHIAAAVDTPSVAIAGGWHFNRFLPYHIEDVRPEGHIPLIAYTEMPCYYCDFRIEENNVDCQRMIHTGQLLECIERVSFEQVKDLVSQFL